MIRDKEEHVRDKIQPFLDGELSSSESDAVRAHCAGCAEFARYLADIEAVRGALEADEVPSPLRSMWPAVKSSLDRRSSRGFDLSFGLAASAAAVAGVALGLLLGASGDLPDRMLESPDTDAEGSLLGDYSVPTLDEVYVYSFEENGDD